MKGKCSIPKSYAFVLIFLCAVAFQITSSAPLKETGKRLILFASYHRQNEHHKILQQLRQHRLHHMHHRSINKLPESLLNNSISICKKMQEVKKILTATHKTYSFIRDSLEEYTACQFNKTPEQVHRDWYKHPFTLDHPLKSFLSREIDQMPPESNFSHISNNPMTADMLAREMSRVYITLRTLKAAFACIISDRQKQKLRLLHDVPGSDSNKKSENLNTIDKFFSEIYKYVKSDVLETEHTMRQLSVPVPAVDESQLSTRCGENQQRSVGWLLASEHLSVMQALRRLYMEILKKCPNKSE